MTVPEARELLEQLVDSHGGIPHRQARNCLKGYERDLMVKLEQQAAARGVIRDCVDRLAAACRRGLFRQFVFIVADEVQKIRKELE